MLSQNIQARFVQRLCLSVSLSLVLFFAVTSALLADENSAPLCASEDKNALRLAMVARGETIESESLFNGVLQSCSNDTWQSSIQIQKYVYDSDSEGFEIISNIVKEASADVIIGPSESSLYADLVDFLKFEGNNIPIISPVVTVRLGNKPEGWFFRTNVDAASRAQTIYDFLSTKGIQNFAMLYKDSTFGEIAESAFRTELSDVQRTQFNSFRFATAEQSRPWIKQVNAQRPEAIGIIGSRQEVKQISDLLKKLHNEWNAYDPYVFTIVDTRALALDGTYFLSVGSEGELESDIASGELLDLSADTTSLVIMIADDLLKRDISPGSPKWPWEFRKRLVGAMSGSISKLPSKTAMKFIGLRNITTPKVMMTEDNKVSIVKETAESGWLKAMNNWVEIRKRRFGVAPLVNLALIGFIVVFLTIVDLRKSHRVSGRDLIRIPFVSLILLNVAIASLLFTYIAENEVSEWDSILGALLVAFGYSGMLKTTIFETAAGQSIGIRRYYENLVVWIYDRIRKQQFEKVGPVINYIAYSNSSPYLQSTLLESYGFAGDEARTQELSQYLNDELSKQNTIFGQRKVLAKEVYKEVSWAKLQERRIVPRSADPNDINDPEPIVDESVNYCFRNDQNCLDELEKLVNKKLEKQEFSDLKQEFTDDLKSSTTPKAKIASCVRWIILLLGYDLHLLVKQGLLPSNFKIQTDKSFVSKLFNTCPNERERRKFTRVNNHPTTINLEYEGQTLKGKLVDISEGGARIALETHLDAIPETALISSADDAVVALERTPIEIINVNQESDLKTMLGVTWSKLSRKCRGNINGYLRTVLQAQ